ncbi:MAG: M23 family metallopeptidase [Flammeovirgaceae bacterium]
MRSCWNLKLSNIVLLFGCFPATTQPTAHGSGYTLQVRHRAKSLHFGLFVSIPCPSLSIQVSSGFITLFILFLSIQSFAQFKLSDELNHSKSTEVTSTYQFPVNPGQPNFLAGTMGELRNTHFHAGIDVRTNNMVGMPILATQSGYVSRIIVGTGGYGHAMMITHPDGNASLYGHLDQFKGSIAKHILEEHYSRKSFDLDLNFTPTQYPITKGDTIGLSGNTGGSSGPHLHFEIRNSNNEALNPLAFGFTEIEDKIAPLAFRIALKTMDVNARVNDKFGRFEFGLVRSGNTARLPAPIFAHGKIGIEILAHDKLDRSQFRTGISKMEVYVDSILTFQQQIDKVDFNTSRDIVTLMDYKSLKTKGVHFNKLYIEDGNPLQFYPSKNPGFVQVNEGTKKIKIVLRDFAGNESTAIFSLKYDPHTNEVPFLENLLKPLEYEVAENTLVIHSKPCGAKEKSILLFEKGKKVEVNTSYRSINHLVYLIDLKKSLPDSIVNCQGSIVLNYKDVVPSKTDYTHYSNHIDIQFPNGALYDTLYLSLCETQKNNRTIYSIGNLLTPIHGSVTIKLKETGIDGNKKIAAYHLEANRYEYVGGAWSNDRITFNTTELGDFVLLTDSVAPTITRISCTTLSARFRVGDNLSGIEKYEAKINGEWMLMKYDYKTGILQSERLDKRKFLKGDFELKVKDRAGNERVYRQRIL